MKMVDVGDKELTTRVAVARAELRCSREVLKLLNEGRLEKGDALPATRAAARASPFSRRPSLSSLSTSLEQRSSARATATRVVSSLSPTSTIFMMRPSGWVDHF